MKLYYDEDASLQQLSYCKVAIYGYGSQGHAHAQNLKDSGINVCVALRKESKSAVKAKAAGLKVLNLDEASQWANFHMLLVPDQDQKDLFERYIKKNLKPGDIVSFAHGFNIHFKEITCPNHVDVIMIAPKSPGNLVRETYLQKQGTPCLVAVHQNYSGKAFDTALSYAKAIGGTKAGVLETNFKDETETDLFGEQAVLCGGVSELIRSGYEVLVENGYDKELAYFECLHELKLIVDLFYKGGLSLMNENVSDTAEFGGYQSGPRVIPKDVKIRMNEVLNDIKSGKFAKDYLADARSGQKELLHHRKEKSEHSIEKVGATLRQSMSWLNVNVKRKVG